MSAKLRIDRVESIIGQKQTHCIYYLVEGQLEEIHDS